MPLPSAGGKEGPDAEAAGSEALPPSESSTSLLGSIRGRWRQISDSQRIIRLRQCQVLHDALAECRRGSDLPHKVQNSAASDAESREAASAASTSIETVPAGIRMLHYFQWRNLGKGGDEDESKEDHAERTAIMRDAQRLCTREAHALWACRAVATACGPDLLRVKHCFDEHGPSILRHNAAYERQAPLADASPTTKGESDKQRRSNVTAPSSSTPPCVDVQRALGSCVAEGIQSLNQRKGDYSK